jgi:hypothetical protein
MVASPVVPTSTIGDPIRLMIPMIAWSPFLAASALTWPSIIAGPPVATRPLFTTAALARPYAGSLLATSSLARATRAITTARAKLFAAATGARSSDSRKIAAARKCRLVVVQERARCTTFESSRPAGWSVHPAARDI